MLLYHQHKLYLGGLFIGCIAGSEPSYIMRTTALKKNFVYTTKLGSQNLVNIWKRSAKDKRRTVNDLKIIEMMWKIDHGSGMKL